MKILKRVGQTAAVLYNVLFGPLPVPDQMTVWPRIVIAFAIVASLALIKLTASAIRWLLFAIAILLITIGFVLGIKYWQALPVRTLDISGIRYVVGEPTDATKDQMKKLNVSLRTLIEGQANHDVEEFFTPESVSANKLYLAIYYILFLALGTVGVVVLIELIPDK